MLGDNQQKLKKVMLVVAVAFNSSCSETIFLPYLKNVSDLNSATDLNNGSGKQQRRCKLVGPSEVVLKRDPQLPDSIFRGILHFFGKVIVNVSEFQGDPANPTSTWLKYTINSQYSESPTQLEKYADRTYVYSSATDHASVVLINSGGQNGLDSLLRSTDRGQTFELATFGHPGHLENLLFSKEHHVFIAHNKVFDGINSYSQILVSKDQGLSWQVIKELSESVLDFVLDKSGNIYLGSVSYVGVHPLSGINQYRTKILMSSDLGAHWKEIQMEVTEFQRPYFYVGSNGNIWLTIEKIPQAGLEGTLSLYKGRQGDNEWTLSLVRPYKHFRNDPKFYDDEKHGTALVMAEEYPPYQPLQIKYSGDGGVSWDESTLQTEIEDVNFLTHPSEGLLAMAFANDLNANKTIVKIFRVDFKTNAWKLIDQFIPPGDQTCLTYHAIDRWTIADNLDLYYGVTVGRQAESSNIPGQKEEGFSIRKISCSDL